MKIFVMRARKASTNPHFDINHLPKEGKMDSVCAAISNALWLSGDVRRDVIFHAVLEGPNNGPRTITLIGNEMRGLRSDERSIAEYIKFALQKGSNLVLNQEIHARSGIKIAKKSFEKLVWDYSAKMPVFKLDPKGTDIRKFDFPKDFVIVFGDPIGLPLKSDKFLRELKVPEINIGPKMLFASHCPVIVNNEIDRRIEKK